MSERAPGFEDYTPSRLEWLVVLLNSYVQYLNSTSGGSVEYVYLPGNDGKTIILHISHYDDLPPELLKGYEDSAKRFAMEMAEKYKWGSWIEIQTRFDPIDRPSTKQQD